MSDMKVLLVWSVIQTVLSIIFQIFLVKKFGLYGSTLGLILSFLLTAAWIVPKRVFFHISMAKINE
jgi:O-antigen/teichoic acid export membrane protein